MDPPYGGLSALWHFLVKHNQCLKPPGPRQESADRFCSIRVSGSPSFFPAKERSKENSAKAKAVKQIQNGRTLGAPEAFKTWARLQMKFL
jgi:hypothetical protein